MTDMVIHNSSNQPQSIKLADFHSFTDIVSKTTVYTKTGEASTIKLIAKNNGHDEAVIDKLIK